MKKSVFLMALLFSSFFVLPSAFAGEKDIKLEKLSDSWGYDLGVALKSRKSSREFSDKKVSDKELARIFWAINGINRENGKRTVPTPRGFNFIKVFHISRNGNFLYDAAQNSLVLVSGESIVDKVGKQPWVASTSNIIAYVADLKAYGAPTIPEDKIKMGMVVGGCMAQNAYLSAASLGMGACIVFGFDKEVLTKSLSLTENEVLLFIQPFGFLK
ncbi:MAG: nitroreductase family protein [Candidatus Riflebacteria bacterium]|nr:nitroreductase family protein [Candidatus Riflebacteria bacterium]